MTGPDPSLGQLLRRYRLLAGLTQEELAERSAYSTDYISKLERDQRQPPLVTIDRLAAVLGLGQPEHQTLRAARERHERAAPASRAPRWAPLPAAPTPLVGRVAEQAAVWSALDTSRLVTLTGAGGTGKTRLALEVARRAAEGRAFADGVAFVDCGPLTSHGLLGPTIARALGLVEQPDLPSELRLLEALRSRHLLLVIDTLEHLLAETPLLSRLLAAAPQLHILATSRAPLHLYGEYEVHVPPLSLPSAGGEPSDQGADASEAVQLFVARARAVAPGFDAGGSTGATLGALCRALDGLPLAIELAAARVTLFPPEALLDRLGECLAVLADGPRDLPHRQQTLRATLDWSFRLLAPPEQALFTHLGVFAGSFDARAAAAICTPDTASGPEPELGHAAERMLPRLAALANQSLIEIAPGATPRFRLLDTTRAYARERLQQGDAGSDVRDRHLRYYRALAEELSAAIKGMEQAAGMARLEAEHDNLRAALGWARERGRLADGLRLAGALGQFWRLQGYFEEGRSWLEGLLALPDDRADESLRAERAQALVHSGGLAWRQGAYRQATAFLADALALFRALGDTIGAARALNSLGNVAYRQGEYADAASLFGEALTIWRGAGYTRGVSIALGNLGRVALKRGDDAAALALLEETLVLKRELRDAKGIAGTLTSLGRIAIRRGDDVQAAALLTESLALKRDLGDREGRVITLDLLGRVALARHDQQQARTLLGEALGLASEIGAWDRMPEVLEDLAALAATEGRFEDAMQRGGAAAALRASLGLPLPPEQQARHAHIEQQARAALGDDGFAAAWADGVTRPLEERIARTLARLAPEPEEP